MIYKNHVAEKWHFIPVPASASSTLLAHTAHIVVAIVGAPLSALRPVTDMKRMFKTNYVLEETSAQFLYGSPAPLVKQSHKGIDRGGDEALRLLHLLHRLLDLLQGGFIALGLGLGDGLGAVVNL